ncbi:MAG TPA: FAD-dependent oxidoreductase [Pirellulales bacterium]|jgi:glycine/D-amino acid oxidase-like deaminating enzyme/nitrite reductase/ring-hydroxylating ferredoxin subunit|nr:FAD-dependent oxidoreductase [Pirellulales bacterium]
MNTQPVWRETPVPKFGKLDRSAQFDVAVVGGGITGLSAAYQLKRAGKKVCVLERERIGSVDTGHTTAHLTCVMDTRLTELAKKFGKDVARLAWQAGREAIDTIESISRREGIACEFRRIPGYLHASLEKNEEKTNEESDDLRAEADLARELDFDAEFLARVPCVDRPGVRLANQAKFNPMAYLAGLAERIDGDGCAIYEQTEAEEFEVDPLAVKCGAHTIRADHLVMATHMPLTGKSSFLSASLLQTKLYAFSSYVIGAAIPKGALPEASFWDTSQPYYYLRIDAHADSDYAIFGGLDHKTGQETEPQGSFHKLESLLKTIVPRLNVDHCWSGQVIETNDMLPLIGESSPGQFVATGFAGNGMTFGTLSGRIATDYVLGRENPWQDIFAVDRKKIIGGAWRCLRQNTDYPYYMLKDRLTPAEGSSPDDVARNEGKILKIDGQRVACSRDAHGKVTMLSAVCTHLGCIVHWNDAEATWDCPCHGSRFTPSGEKFAGPAERSLEPFEPKKAKVHGPANGDAKKKPRRKSSAAKSAAKKGR